MNNDFQEDVKRNGLFSTMVQKLSDIEKFIRDHRSVPHVSSMAVGTWTPIDASGAGLAFTTAVGAYIKIGGLVYVSCNIVYPVTASGLAAIIGGLPFAPASVSGLSVGYQLGGAAAYTYFLSPVFPTYIRPLTPLTIVQPTNAQVSTMNFALGGTYLA